MPHSDLARRAFDVVAAMPRARTLDELDDLVAPMFADFGLPSFAAARFYRSDRAADTTVLFGRFNPAWAEQYLAHNYARYDAVAREMLASPDAYAWSEVKKRRKFDRVQSRIWNEARQFGCNDGLFTPMRRPDGGYAAVVLSGRDADMQDRFLRTAVHVLSVFYGSEGVRLMNEGARKRVLTPRQRECLAWVREGKSSSDIAEILSLSVPTVNAHVADACRRLGVRTRVQAAVEACLRGLIDHAPPPAEVGASPEP